MSIYHKLKSDLRLQRQGGGGLSNNNKGGNVGGGKHGPEDEIVVLPEKPLKKRKMMEVQKESKYTLAAISAKKGGNQSTASSMVQCHMEVDDEEQCEDKDDKELEKDRKVKKVPWGPPDILNHLDNPALLNNINYVIDDLKKTIVDKDEIDPKTGKKKEGGKTEIAWDHSESKEGKKSDNNFFVWFESVAANEARKVMEKENLIYEN